MTDTLPDTAPFVRDRQDWHRRHEEALATPHGFLAVTGLHWPTSRPQRFPGLPGRWHTGDDRVVVDLADGEQLTVDGQPDLHRATNLPCAYTDFATWPLPPVENRLPVAVEAGEKLPYERHASAGQP
ncbi:DUF1684 domain-containing protein [Micromonospora matsumotoense]|uniref:DUF1684 domain-containing protein n=1 Tax=Micromonospora matsumotoense TaxID=121616 RepID=UPI003D8ADFBD